ncbi:hypothetical protein PG997_006182 [Apiospora hydei]|uniref:Rhodopsin domain-containing protein n=1 Tax=Apiospora hydei TaxID=1337664 RepID=A0ABR1WMZ1_9PEZI
MVFLFPIERPEPRALFGCAIVFSLVPSLFVALRLIARRKAGRELDASDYLILVALVNVLGYQGLNMACVLVGGAGWHVKELTERFGIESGPTTFIKMMLAQQIVWATSLAFTKISILVLYCRIFTLRMFTIVAWVTSVVILLWVILVVAGSLAICQPAAFNWDQTIPGGHCGDSVKLWLSHGILNIITDMVVLLLPMPVLYQLQMVLYKKVVLMFTFGMGLGVVVISAFRLHSLVEVDMTDVTYTVPLPIMWSALEPCLGITLACVPLLRPLLGGDDKHSSNEERYDMGGVKTIQTIGQKKSRKFDQLRDDDCSITQLTSTTPPPFRSEPLHYTADVVSKDTSGSDDDATDKGEPAVAINVKKGLDSGGRVS